MSGHEYHKPEHWWVSPYNYIDPVESDFSIPDSVIIHDVTLRDGEQTPGVVMTPDNKLEIARLLDEVGIERIEAGMPAVSDDDFVAIRSIVDAKLNAKIYSFARARTDDIDSAIDAGVDGVIIEIPIGYPKLVHQFGWTWEEVLRRSVPVINYAREHGLHTVYFPYDTTRARFEDLEQLLDGIMRDAPPDGIGIVDTVGCAVPMAIKYLVRHVISKTGLPVEIHTHNDFGMALATELAAVEAGASVVHGAANGLGERTGNTATEELVMAMKVLYQLPNPYRLDRLLNLASKVESISGVSPAVNKPVIGSRNFTRESGIGVDLVIKNPLAMFATEPKLTGRSGDVVLGKKSGKLSVLYHLEKRGYTDVSDQTVEELVQRVKKAGIAKRGLLTSEEFDEIVQSVL
jgi:methanogen homocitrate synthase